MCLHAPAPLCKCARPPTAAKAHTLTHTRGEFKSIAFNDEHTAKRSSTRDRLHRRSRTQNSAGTLWQSMIYNETI